MESPLPSLSNITVPIALSHTNSARIVQRWFVENSEFSPIPATYRPLVNGEEAFRAVFEAIAEAEKSVEIICWGFQPSMYFIRDGCHPCIGELLRIKAANGVKVRILGWEMPFNSAGMAGEGNLPGKGSLRLNSRAMQSSTKDQFKYDRDWFSEYAVSDGKAAERVNGKSPVFVSRGFSANERLEIKHWVKYEALDPNISVGMQLVLSASASHHQKNVLVDYELPSAVGFVMGHNSLDEYWDTDQHSALNREEGTKPAPYLGSRGSTPRQDISCMLSGPILHDVHQNFAIAWRKETGEDLLACRDCDPTSNRLQFQNGTRLMMQVLRTQAQVGQPKTNRKHKDDVGDHEKPVRDIQSGYMVAANNVTQFIYIENQYFRWPPLADHLKTLAGKYFKAGRKEPLYLFVVTNDTKDGVGMGTAKTQEMLASLGRAETIPAITKLRMIKEMKREAPVRPRPDGPNDRAGQRKLDEWQAEIDRKTKEIEDTKLELEPVPGLKIHVCSLVARDLQDGQPWMPVYIHSKLMIVDDVYTTHGSANINTRSMMVDSELNICHEHPEFSQPLRRRLWDLHTMGLGGQDEPKEAFTAWQEIIEGNKRNKSKKLPPNAPVVEFYYSETTMTDFD
ncbi:phospholipase D-like domain-containing protein [Pseudomonas alliivorans]|nr:phospholipase D-like domain-containing protein [Pseudomonas alliivorans]